jgi:hypothetical protein
MSTPVHPYALDILGKVIRQEKLITQIGMKEAELPVSVGDMNLCAGNEKKKHKRNKQPIPQLSNFTAHKSLHTLAMKVTTLS